MSNDVRTMPVIALRGMNIFPGMMIHFDVGRKITVSAIEEALVSDQKVFIVAQKEDTIELPNEEDLYEVGTICVVKQLVRLPEEQMRVMVTGIERASIIELLEMNKCLRANVEVYDDTINYNVNDVEEEAMIRHLRELMKIYATANGKSSLAFLRKLSDIKKVATMIDEIAGNIAISLEDKQLVLSTFRITDRFQCLCSILTKEIDIIRIKKEYQAKVKEEVDKNQKEYLLREQLKVIRHELGETDTVSETDKYLQMLKKLKASKEIKAKIKEEIERFRTIGSSSAENTVSRGYIETLLSLPWDKVSKDNNDIKHAETILNEDHYGLKKVKERILEFLAVRALTSKGESPIICLVGPPGTGKTSIARSVAKSLDKKYVRICLGGVRDEAEIRGHRRTYVGALPGRLAMGLKQAGVKNPLMLLDEIDKVSSDYKGDTSSALLEVLDSEQNKHFVDHYVEIPMDLSEVLFIATANSVQTIPRPLLDRMEVIEVSSYTENEKYHIAKEHLIPKTKEKNGLNENDLSISDNALEQIIHGYTREAGVRTLERRLGEICRKSARELLEKQSEKIKEDSNDSKSKAKSTKKATSTINKDEFANNPIKVTTKNLEHYLGKVKYTYTELNEKDEVGIVRGLAWTSVGGDTLEIEVNVMPGKGEFKLTGQLGDVMKESAMTGISYIRSIAEKKGIKKEFFEKNDIHIHIPEGAVPKDGPSAGITMATAVLSAITNQKVKRDIAMTGEITLRGRVLPVGGLKEKILAAKMAKIKMVLVPKKNEKDIEEIESEIKAGIEIRYVEQMEEVLELALC